MAFEDITPRMNELATRHGTTIYESLRGMYPDVTLESLDIMLNSICVAILRMAENHVPIDDRRAYVQLVYQILMKNIN